MDKILKHAMKIRYLNDLTCLFLLNVITRSVDEAGQVALAVRWRPVRLPPASASHLPGICAQPPLQSADPKRTQEQVH